MSTIAPLQSSVAANKQQRNGNQAVEAKAVLEVQEFSTRSVSTQTSEGSQSLRFSAGLQCCNETLVDVFSFLSRDDIEAVQISSRSMRSLVDSQMEDKCLRRLEEVNFGRLGEKRLLFSAHIRIGNDEGSRYVQCIGKNSDDRCIPLLKRCVTHRFSICNVTFDPHIARTITAVAAHIRIIDDLLFCDDASVGQTNATELVRSLLTALTTVPEVRFKNMHIRWSVSNNLLRTFDEANVDAIFVSDTGSTVADGGVIRYLLEKPPTKRSAKSANFYNRCAFTSALFVSLVKASYTCKSLHKAHLTVASMRLEDQNTDAYVDRGTVDGSHKVFNFSDADVPFRVVFRKVDDVDEMVYERGSGSPING